MGNLFENSKVFLNYKNTISKDVKLKRTDCGNQQNTINLKNSSVEGWGCIFFYHTSIGKRISLSNIKSGYNSVIKIEITRKRLESRSGK